MREKAMVLSRGTNREICFDHVRFPMPRGTHWKAAVRWMCLEFLEQVKVEGIEFKVIRKQKYLKSFRWMKLPRICSHSRESGPDVTLEYVTAFIH